MEPARERGLILRARTDQAAFFELYDFYLPRVYSFVARRAASRPAAEEITGVTFQRGLEVLRSGGFRSDTFGGWLYRVAASAVVDRDRRGARDPLQGVRAGDFAEPGAERPEPLVGDEVATAAFAGALDRDELRQALARVTEGQRRVLVLKFLDDLTTPELCAAMGISAATLELRLHRALRALHLATVRKDIHAA